MRLFMLQMDNRYEKIASHIPEHHTLADIGTDQGILPVTAIQKRHCPFVIASDVRKQPLERARSYGKKMKCEQLIDFRLGDGLDVLQPYEVETVVIAGIGSRNIFEILNRNQLVMKSIQQLILVPHSEPWIIRQWGYQNNLFLGDEDLIYQGKQYFYEILVYYPNLPSHHLDLSDIILGPYLKKRRDPLKKAYFKRRYEQSKRHCDNLLKTDLLEQKKEAQQLLAIWKEVGFDGYC